MPEHHWNIQFLTKSGILTLSKRQNKSLYHPEKTKSNVKRRDFATHNSYI